MLLAGHSFGGAVITNAATSAPNVTGLVFIAAFAPDEGERLGEATGGSKDAILGTAQVRYRYPAGPTGTPRSSSRLTPRSFGKSSLPTCPPSRLR